MRVAGARPTLPRPTTLHPSHPIMVCHQQQFPHHRMVGRLRGLCRPGPTQATRLQVVVDIPAIPVMVAQPLVPLRPRRLVDPHLVRDIPLKPVAILRPRVLAIPEAIRHLAPATRKRVATIRAIPRQGPTTGRLVIQWGRRVVIRVMTKEDMALLLVMVALLLVMVDRPAAMLAFLVAMVDHPVAMVDLPAAMVDLLAAMVALLVVRPNQGDRLPPSREREG